MRSKWKTAPSNLPNSRELSLHILTKRNGKVEIITPISTRYLFHQVIWLRLVSLTLVQQRPKENLSHVSSRGLWPHLLAWDSASKSHAQLRASLIWTTSVPPSSWKPKRRERHAAVRSLSTHHTSKPPNRLNLREQQTCKDWQLRDNNHGRHAIFLKIKIVDCIQPISSTSRESKRLQKPWSYIRRTVPATRTNLTSEYKIL